MSNAKTGTIEFNGTRIQYYPESLKILTDVRTNGFTLESTIMADIYADTVRPGSDGDAADYDKVWGWSMTVDELGGEHLADYIEVAEASPDDVVELRGEYSCH